MIPISTDPKPVLLHHRIDTSCFDCGEEDLNEFLQKHAMTYLEESFARTILFIHNEELIGYVALCADSIRLSTKEKKKVNKDSFRLSDFPAFKIARLAVGKKFQKRGYGKFILFWALGYIKNIAPGTARFATIDAEPEAIGFYEKYRFTRNLHKRYKEENRMATSFRFDLRKLATA